MVDIHVRREDNDEWICGLEVPLEDIQRFSLRPLKWLRFVAFAVLGAKGDLFDAPGSDRNIVNYDTVSVADLGERYYFFHDGPYHFVDPKGLADNITASTASTRHDSREDVARRDNNRCVIKGTIREECHAAHIIPQSKGDEYISIVLSNRRSLYEDQQSDLDIDSTENRMFLDTGLHSRFGRGASAFLKTPNFALDPADIPSVKPGEIPASRTTIQHFEPWDPEDEYPVLQGDVRVDWTVQDAPPRILLDYMYGVAVIRRWATADIKDLLEKYQETYYETASTPFSIPKDDHGVQDDDDNPDGPPGSQFSEYVPSQRVRHRGIHQTRTEAAHCRAIDTAIAFSMFIKGYPPGTTFDTLLQKQEEEAEMRSRQVAQEKVQGWLETSESLPPSHDGQEACVGMSKDMNLQIPQGGDLTVTVTQRQHPFQ